MQAAQHTGQGQQAAQEPLRRRISNFLARFVDRFRIAMLVILIAAAAFLVGYFIYGEVNKKITLNATALAETVQAQYDKWQAESDATKKATLSKDLLAQLGTLIDRYPRQYGGERGLLLRAEVNYANKTWDAALKDYEAIATRFPQSYLAPIGLFDAAICYEEKGDMDTALKLYTRAYDSYKDSIVAPRAMFNAGRLDEAKADWTAAQTIYTQIDSLHGQSIWNKLAKNRLIALKVDGKIK